MQVASAIFALLRIEQNRELQPSGNLFIRAQYIADASASR